MYLPPSHSSPYSSSSSLMYHTPPSHSAPYSSSPPSRTSPYSSSSCTVHLTPRLPPSRISTYSSSSLTYLHLTPRTCLPRVPRTLLFHITPLPPLRISTYSSSSSLMYLTHIPYLPPPPSYILLLAPLPPSRAEHLNQHAYVCTVLQFSITLPTYVAITWAQNVACDNFHDVFTSG